MFSIENTQKITVALIGNPNCGKTTLFNFLTGSKQYVGNWPGVTVEKKEGTVGLAKILNQPSLTTTIAMTMTDLPGIYSLSPYSMEEIVTREYIIETSPDFILNIVDATALERNLFLTTQIMDLKTPTVLALNRMDEVKAKGIEIDIPALERELGIRVFPISATKGEGISELLTYFCDSIPQKEKIAAKIHSAFPPAIAAAIVQAEKIAFDYRPIYTRWFAIKFLENDQKALSMTSISDLDKQKIIPIQKRISPNPQEEITTVLSNYRYAFIHQVITKVKQEKREHDLSFSDKLDSILTNRLLGIPIFLCVMLLIFQITFGFIGTTLQEFTLYLIQVPFTSAVTFLLTFLGTSPLLQSLVVDGILTGVGSVISFVPQIMLLFFFLSFLEDSGYMARVAFVMDILLRKIGLNGKAFIPMVLGFGCTVPAIMATRALEKDNDRRLTIMLVPFISCSARAPVYAVFIAAFFPGQKGLITFFLYFLGIAVAIGMGLLLKKTIFRSDGMPFIMELPQYRFPPLKGLFLTMWEKGKSFLIKAGTVIFIASIVIWGMQTFNFRFQVVQDTADSMIASIGKWIAPIFTPLGFGDWRASAALLTGLSAKEAVVSTLEILYTSGTSTNLINTLHFNGLFTQASALSYMTFILLYTPCIAAIAAMKKEFASWKWTFGTIGYQLCCAYGVSFLVYRIALLLF